MVLVFINVIQVNEDIIKIYYHTNIKEVRKYIVYKLLESCRGIGKAKRYNCLFKGFVASTESCFPFVAFYNIY